MLYRISSDKHPRWLFNFVALRCGAYWRAALRKGNRLFQSEKIYSCEISKICHFLHQNNFQSNFIEITLRHDCSRVYLLHIFRTPFPENSSEWLLLKIFPIKVNRKPMLNMGEERVSFYSLTSTKFTSSQEFFERLRG